MSECWTRGRTITFTPKVQLPTQTEQEMREEDFDEARVRKQLDEALRAQQLTCSRWTPEQDTILKDYYGKVLVRNIAKALGHPEQSVQRRARQLGLRSELRWGKK